MLGRKIYLLVPRAAWMVWLEIDDAAGSDWKGIAVDGYLSRNGLEEGYRKQLGERPSRRHALDEMFREIAENYLRGKAGGWAGKLGAPNRGRATAELFVVDYRESLGRRNFSIGQDHASIKDGHYRHLILVHSGYSRDRFSGLLDIAGFTSKRLAHYENFSRFSKATANLTESMIEKFVLPAEAISDGYGKKGLSISNI